MNRVKVFDPMEPLQNQQLSLHLAAAIDRMPAFPKSVQRLLELTQDAGCMPKDLVQVIEKDPVLTVKMLKMVNSAYFGLPKQITSVGHAVVYLGFGVTKNMAVTMAAIGMLPKHNSAGFDWQAYLLHSLACAAIAKQLAARVEGADPMDCFVAGLLHDFGKVVLAQFMAAPFGQALENCRRSGGSLHLAMRDTLGADHAAVGAMLVEKWRFSPAMVETIANQYGPDPKDTGMVACVFAANQAAKKLEFGYAGNPCVSELPSAIATRLGGSLDEVIASLGDLRPLFQDAKLFATIG